MPCGDPMWRCPYCGKVHYAAHRITCDCPKSMQQRSELSKAFDAFFNDEETFQPRSKETVRERLGLNKEPTLNELYEDFFSAKVEEDLVKQHSDDFEFKHSCACAKRNVANALDDRERRLREEESERAYLEKLDKEEKRGDNGGLDAMIEDLFDQQDAAELNELIEETIEEQRRKDDLEVRSVVETFEKEARKQTLVVNLFAGPGAGKSTTAAGLFFELKSRGINCELAAEYAKDLTWEERHRTFQNQVYIFGKQHHRIFRLLGQVEVVITDSPLLLSVVYDGEKRETLKQLVYEEHRKMWTYNAFIKRVKKFNPKGRIHGFDEAKALDNMILDTLDDAGECYEVFDGTPEGMSKIVQKVLGLLAYHKSLKK